jgi:hypothetical protein
LEKQATQFLAFGFLADTYHVSPPYSRDAIMAALLFNLTKDEYVDDQKACQRLIKEHATVHDKTVTRISPNAIPELTKAPCRFFDPSDRPSLWKVVNILAPIFIGIIAAALTSVVVFAALWILAYQHLGWRRLSVAVAPLLGICSGTIQWFVEQDISSTIVVAVVGTILFGPLILGSRELYLWVAKGFKTEKR